LLISIGDPEEQVERRRRATNPSRRRSAVPSREVFENCYGVVP
jgi:hypothetical protein